jgi:hypothetical protein
MAAGTAAVLDILLDRTDPIFALRCLRSSLDGFLEADPETTEATGKALAMGLQAFGALFRSLPGEVLEEELPLAKSLLLQVGPSCLRPVIAYAGEQGLASAYPDTRHAAMLSLVAAHQSLQSQEQLFAILAPDLTHPQCASPSFRCCR